MKQLQAAIKLLGETGAKLQAEAHRVRHVCPASQADSLPATCDDCEESIRVLSESAVNVARALFLLRGY